MRISRRGLLVACVVWGVGLIGCGEEEPPPDRAWLQMEAEIAPLRSELEGQPESPLLHFQMGEIFLKHGLIDSAQVAFERAVILRPELAEAHFQLAQIHYKEGRTDEAIAAYRQAVAQRPDYALAYNNLAYIYKQTGVLDEAEEAYKQAIKYMPDLFQAYNNLGQLYKQQERFDEALPLYEKALELNPAFPEAYVNLAMLYQLKGEDASEMKTLRAYLDRFGAAGEHSLYAAERLQELTTLEETVE